MKTWNPRPGFRPVDRRSSLALDPVGGYRLGTPRPTHSALVRIPGPVPRITTRFLSWRPRLGRCDRPENRPQALGNIESAPGNVRSSSRGVRRTTRAMQRNPGAGALPDRHAAEARRETRAFGRLTGLAMLAWALGDPGPNAGLGVAIARKIGRKVLKTWNPRPGIFGPSSRGDRRATPRSRGTQDPRRPAGSLRPLRFPRGPSCGSPSCECRTPAPFRRGARRDNPDADQGSWSQEAP